MIDPLSMRLLIGFFSALLAFGIWNAYKKEKIPSVIAKPSIVILISIFLGSTIYYNFRNTLYAEDYATLSKIEADLSEINGQNSFWERFIYGKHTRAVKGKPLFDKLPVFAKPESDSSVVYTLEKNETFHVTQERNKRVCSFFQNTNGFFHVSFTAPSEPGNLGSKNKDYDGWVDGKKVSPGER